MNAAAQTQKVFWHSDKGRAIYLAAVVAGSFAYITLLYFLVSKSIITYAAYTLGFNIFWIPYLILMFLTPTKNEKDSRVTRKILPYLIIDGAICIALLLFAYLTSNSTSNMLDYNSSTFIIPLAFVGTSILMMAIVDLKDWLARRKMAKPKSKNPPAVSI